MFILLTPATPDPTPRRRGHWQCHGYILVSRYARLQQQSTKLVSNTITTTRLILNAKADPDATDTDKDTALHHAARKGHPDVQFDDFFSLVRVPIVGG